MRDFLTGVLGLSCSALAVANIEAAPITGVLGAGFIVICVITAVSNLMEN